jgi:hypothetical protein
MVAARRKRTRGPRGPALPPSGADNKIVSPKKEADRGKVLEGHAISEIRVHELVSLRDHFPSRDVNLSDTNPSGLVYHQVLGEEDYILADIVRGRGIKSKNSSEAFVRAGPRSLTHFDPRTVKAAIVT